MKKLSMLFILSLLLFGLTNCAEDQPMNENGEGEIVAESCQSNKPVYLNQTDTINAKDLWSNSMVCENLKLEDNQIKLQDQSEKGTLETNDFYINDFVELVPSWNLLMSDNSGVSIYVSIGNESGYSKYYTMAMLKKVYQTSGSNETDDYGKTSIDTIMPIVSNIDRIKFKVIINKDTDGVTALKNISITTKPKEDTFNYDLKILKEKNIDVLPRQQLAVPVNGNLICSPTSLSMVMAYYNHFESQSEVSRLVYDEGAKIYGNWSLNVGYAGGFDDLFARVEYTKDFNTLMTYINQDIPVVLSIKTRSKEDLKGSIMAYPSGHLIVLTGFTQIDGTWYALVNDPAEYDDFKVKRIYKLSELLDAFKGYTYVLKTTAF